MRSNKKTFGGRKIGFTIIIALSLISALLGVVAYYPGGGILDSDNNIDLLVYNQVYETCDGAHDKFECAEQDYARINEVNTVYAIFINNNDGSINDYGASCTVEYENDPTTYNMDFDNNINRFYHNQTFSTSGEKEFNITCNSAGFSSEVSGISHFVIKPPVNTPFINGVSVDRNQASSLNEPFTQDFVITTEDDDDTQLNVTWYWEGVETKSTIEDIDSTDMFWKPYDNGIDFWSNNGNRNLTVVVKDDNDNSYQYEFELFIQDQPTSPLAVLFAQSGFGIDTTQDFFTEIDINDAYSPTSIQQCSIEQKEFSTNFCLADRTEYEQRNVDNSDIDGSYMESIMDLSYIPAVANEIWLIDSFNNVSKYDSDWNRLEVTTKAHDQLPNSNDFELKQIDASYTRGYVYMMIENISNGDSSTNKYIARYDNDLNYIDMANEPNLVAFDTYLDYTAKLYQTVDSNIFNVKVYDETDTLIINEDLTGGLSNAIHDFEFIYGNGTQYNSGAERYYLMRGTGFDYVTTVETYDETHTLSRSQFVGCLDIDTLEHNYFQNKSDGEMYALVEFNGDLIFDIPFIEDKTITILSGGVPNGRYTYTWTPNRGEQTGPISYDISCVDDSSNTYSSETFNTYVIPKTGGDVGDGGDSGGEEPGNINIYTRDIARYSYAEVKDVNYFDVEFRSDTPSGWNSFSLDWNGTETIENYETEVSDYSVKMSGYLKHETQGSFEISASAEDGAGTTNTFTNTVNVGANTKNFWLENNAFDQYFDELSFDLTFDIPGTDTYEFCEVYQPEDSYFSREYSPLDSYSEYDDLFFEEASDSYYFLNSSDKTITEVQDDSVVDTYDVSTSLDFIHGIKIIGDTWYMIGQHTNSSATLEPAIAQLDLSFNFINRTIVGNSGFDMSEVYMTDITFDSSDNPVVTWTDGASTQTLIRFTGGELDLNLGMEFVDVQTPVIDDYNFIGGINISDIQFIDDAFHITFSHENGGGIVKLSEDFLGFDDISLYDQEFNGGSFYRGDGSETWFHYAYESVTGDVVVYEKTGSSFIDTFNGPFDDGSTTLTSNSGAESFEFVCFYNEENDEGYPRTQHFGDVLYSEISDSYFVDKDDDTWMKFALNPDDSFLVEVTGNGGRDFNPQAVFEEFDDFNNGFYGDMWDSANSGFFGSDTNIDVSFIDNDYYNVVYSDNDLQGQLSHHFYNRNGNRYPIFESRVKVEEFTGQNGVLMGFFDGDGGDSSYFAYGDTLFGTNSSVNHISYTVNSDPLSTIYADSFVDLKVEWSDVVTFYINDSVESVGMYDYFNNNRLGMYFGHSGGNPLNATVDYVQGYYQHDDVTITEPECFSVAGENRCYIEINNTGSERVEVVTYNIGSLGLGSNLDYNTVSDVPNPYDYVYDTDGKIIMQSLTYPADSSKYYKISQNSVDAWSQTRLAMSMFSTFDYGSFANDPYFISSVECCGQTQDAVFTNDTVLINNTFMASNFRYATPISTIETDFRIADLPDDDSFVILGIAGSGGSVRLIVGNETDTGFHFVNSNTGDTYFEPVPELQRLNDSEFHRLKITRVDPETLSSEVMFYIDNIEYGPFTGVYIDDGDLYPANDGWNNGVLEVDTTRIYNPFEIIEREYSQLSVDEIVVNLTNPLGYDYDSNVFIDWYDFSGDLVIEEVDASTFSSGVSLSTPEPYSLVSTTPNDVIEYNVGEDIVLSIDWIKTNIGRERVVWNVDNVLQKSFYTESTISNYTFDESDVGTYNVSVTVGENSLEQTWTITITEESVEDGDDEEPEDDDDVVSVVNGGGGSWIDRDSEEQTVEDTRTEINTREPTGLFSVVAPQFEGSTIELNNLNKKLFIKQGETKEVIESIFNTQDVLAPITLDIIQSNTSEWVELNDNSLNIPAYDERSFGYNVNIPSDAKIGQYNVVIEIYNDDVIGQYTITINVLPKDINMYYYIAGGIGTFVVLLVIINALKKK